MRSPNAHAVMQNSANRPSGASGQPHATIYIVYAEEALLHPCLRRHAATYCKADHYTREFKMLGRRVITALILMFGLAASLTSAWAAPRTFPAGTLRGTLQATTFPQVQIDGKAM